MYMSKKCQISQRQANNGYSVSHSHIRTKKLQHINLQKKKIWSKRESRWIKIRISTKTLKSRHQIIL
uniref:Large ribosomal subunit protein bL28c n=1 Tax=Corallina officinalis TaxID=35170 RepID=A0A6M3W9W4_COROI|nr:50S ribosomal protein L28 [Corallina officinalis]QJF58598.1 50S ribosomal protein L28 [Corallina officinalis]QJF58797.1 50S ribosomal protein L28 [Corallina officinalis]QJF58996.1 50S ribosomal protein L28 [Corallina officinalis]